jgi:phosphonopyruvate decarboxylase
VLSVISGFKDSGTLILASTGKIGRELFEIEDSPHQFYMVGSLGCISSMGLGLSLTRPDKKIIAIDGDGALLMRMGSLATNGFFANDNLIHILIDNRAHDSTGGQPTVSENVDFTAIAHACGYGRAVQINTFSELQDQLNLWKHTPVLTFLHVRVEKGSKKNLGRPTITPPQVKDRFMAFIDSGAGGYKQ